MGQKDISEKILVAYDDVFADIVNVLLFNGQETIQPEDLEDRGTKSFYKENGRKAENMCDVLDAVEQRGKAEGKAEGRVEGRT